METLVALLRGVNVSGANALNMNSLRLFMDQAGFRNTATYIQSGNIVFEHPAVPAIEIAEKISSLIESRFGFRVAVIAKTAAELKAMAEANPFAVEPGTDTGKLHVTLIAGHSIEAGTEMLSGIHGNDRYIITGNAVYLYCPEGYGRTKFNNAWFEKLLKSQATTRNWRTISALAEMASMNARNFPE